MLGRRRRPTPGIVSPADSSLRVPSGTQRGQTLEEHLAARGVQARDDVAEQLGLNPRPVYRPPGYRR